MKAFIVIASLLFTTASAASEVNPTAEELEEQFAQAKQASLNQAELPEARKYFSSMAGFWQTTMNQSGRTCKAGRGEGVELVLTINEQGRIKDVIGSPWNQKSKCYAKIISGQRAPRPPESPFYLSTVMP